MVNPIQFSQHKDMRGRKVERWTATLGQFSSSGENKQVAQDGLVALLAGVQPYAKTYLFAGDQKTVIMVHQDPINGTWGYDIADAGRSYPCSVLGMKTQRECVEYARNHMEQSYGGVLPRPVSPERED